jgi:hypothetical protein
MRIRPAKNRGMQHFGMPGYFCTSGNETNCYDERLEKNLPNLGYKSEFRAEYQ